MPIPYQMIHIVVVGHPDLAKGLGWLPCLMCERPYAVQLATARTVRQFSKTVLCYPCVMMTKYQTIGVGASRLRERLGLDPL